MSGARGSLCVTEENADKEKLLPPASFAGQEDIQEAPGLKQHLVMRAMQYCMIVAHPLQDGSTYAALRSTGRIVTPGFTSTAGMVWSRKICSEAKPRVSELHQPDAFLEVTPVAAMPRKANRVPSYRESDDTHRGSRPLWTHRRP